MTLIHQTETFIVESHDAPFVSRNDGGHIRIAVKDHSITDRTKLTPPQAIELMRLSIIVGDVLERVMNEQGVPVVKINYEDLGNWAFKRNAKPFLHIHIFGRAENATKQVFPEAVHLPARESRFYEGFEALSADDCAKMQKEIEFSFTLDKYADTVWKA